MGVIFMTKHMRFYFHQTFCFENFGFSTWAFFKYRSCHNSNEGCILLADIQHSQPNMTLYCADCFSWGGNSEHNVESMIMILFSAYLASLSSTSTGSLTRLLWCSQIDTCSNNFGTGCDIVWPLMFPFRQSLKIGDCATCGWWIIQLYRDLFIWWLIFKFPFFLVLIPMA